MALPFTAAPRTDVQRALARFAGGYDGARRNPTIEGLAEVSIKGLVALQAGVQSGQLDAAEMRPSVGMRVRVLVQERHRLDLALGTRYRAEGFTETAGEVEGMILFGHANKSWSWFGNLVYGQAPEGRERDGEVRVATLFALRDAWLIGTDSRMRVRLAENESSARSMKDEEALYDLLVTPTTSWAFDQFVIYVAAGFAGLQVGNDLRAGATATAGLIGTL